MKIYNKIKLDIDSWKVLEEDSYEYDGSLLLCDGTSSSSISSSSFSSSTTSVTETFESYTLGEIDGQGDWAEANASTDRFMVTNASPHGGVRCLLADSDGGNYDLEWAYPITEVSLIDTTFWIKQNNGSPDGPSFGLGVGDITNGANRAVHLKVEGNNIYMYNGASWVSLTSPSNPVNSNTWLKIRIVADIISDTFELYFKDVKYGSAHAFRTTQTSINKFFVDNG
ncbi:MAG: hypothetical protein DRP42_06630, partial [Tenericutes bacterium]